MSVFISKALITFGLLNSMQVFEASGFCLYTARQYPRPSCRDVGSWKGATSALGHVSRKGLCIKGGIQARFLRDPKLRFTNSIFAKAFSGSSSAPDDFVNSANPIAGVARLVSQSIVANAESLANQIDKPSWIQRGGPWATHVYQRIVDQDFDGALRLLTDWDAARQVNEEILLALWHLIPNEVATIDQAYLEASKNLKGDDNTVGTQLTQLAR